MSLETRRLFGFAQDKGQIATLVVAITGALMVALAPRLKDPLLVFCIPLAGVSSYLLLTRRQWTLLCLIFATYADIPRVLSKVHAVPSPNVALLLAAGISVTYAWLRFDQRPLPSNIVLWPLAVYFMVCAFSLIGAEFTSEFFVRIQEYGKAMLIALAASLAVQRREDLRRVAWALALATLLMSSVSTFQYLTDTPHNAYLGLGQVATHWLGGVEQFRIAGPTQDPNFYGLILVGGIPIALSIFLTTRKRTLRLLALATVGTATASLVMTFSRGALIGLAVALLFLALRWRPRFRLVLTLPLLALLLLPLLPTSYFGRLMAVPATIQDVLQGGSGSESSTRGRLSEAFIALAMFREHPILGVGVGNYPPLYQDYQKDLGLDSRTGEREPHSLYLETAAETGALGLLALGAILVLLAVGVRRSCRNFDRAGYRDDASLVWGFGASLSGVMTCSALLHAAKPNHLWLLIGLGLAISTTAQRSRLPLAVAPDTKSRHQEGSA